MPQTSTPLRPRLGAAGSVQLRHCPGKICRRNAQTKKNPSSPREPKKEGGKKKKERKGAEPGAPWTLNV